MNFLVRPLSNLSAGSYYCDRYIAQTTVGCYSQTPQGWYTSEPGFTASNPNDASRWIGTQTSSSSVTLQTYFYYIKYNSLGQQINQWAPFDPNTSAREYDVLGTPTQFAVSISGPSVGPCNTGTWTASVTGCYPPYTYQWYRMWICGGAAAPQSSGIVPDVNCGTWSSVGTSNPLQLYWCGGDGYLRVDVTDAHSQHASAQYFVAGAGGGGAQANRTNDELKLKLALPTQYSVASFPNPFNPTTTISYQLVEGAKVRLEIYDLTGRMVASLLEGEATAGSHSVMWKGTDQSGNTVASGVYLYRFWAQPLSGHSAYLTSGKLVMMK
jgi:hypothetical protein